MSKFTIKGDPALDHVEDGIALRVAHHDVLVPEALVMAVGPYALGNDAVALAGFLASFPTAVSGSLGVSPGAVVDFAERSPTSWKSRAPMCLPFVPDPFAGRTERFIRV
jgi:hypothetical protein